MGGTDLAYGSIYYNIPTKGLSTAFAILFTISGILHIFQNNKYKSWSILWILPGTSILFVAGFICREANAYHPQNASTFAASEGLSGCAVPILTSTLYFILYSLIVTQPHLSPVRVSLLCAIPVFLNCVTISLTSQGTSTLFSPTPPPGSIQSDLGVLKACFILQLFCCITFIGILAVFHRRCSVAKVFNANGNRKIKMIVIFTLYASATFIIIRNVFRTVQIFSSPHSPAWKTEAFFWVFDAVPLLICMLILNAVHPGKYGDSVRYEV